MWFTAEAGPGVIPGQLSVDGGQQLRLDLHDAGHRRTFRQHSLPCQDHVGKSAPPFLPYKFGLLPIYIRLNAYSQSLIFMTTAEYRKANTHNFRWSGVRALSVDRVQEMFPFCKVNTRHLELQTRILCCE